MIRLFIKISIRAWCDNGLTNLFEFESIYLWAFEISGRDRWEREWRKAVEQAEFVGTIFLVWLRENNRQEGPIYASFSKICI